MKIRKSYLADACWIKTSVFLFFFLIETERFIGLLDIYSFIFPLLLLSFLFYMHCLTSLGFISMFNHMYLYTLPPFFFILQYVFLSIYFTLWFMTSLFFICYSPPKLPLRNLSLSALPLFMLSSPVKVKFLFSFLHITSYLRIFSLSSYFHNLSIPSIIYHSFPAFAMSISLFHFLP